MPADNFFRGENVTLKLYLRGKPVLLLSKNWNVNQNATEISEGVGGENRDRLDIVTNSFGGSVDVYQSDQEVMDALIDDQTVRDASGLPLSWNGAVQIRHRNGTKANYLLQEVCVGPWGETMSGRPDAVMLNLKFRFTKWKKVQSF